MGYVLERRRTELSENQLSGNTDSMTGGLSSLEALEVDMDLIMNSIFPRGHMAPPTNFSEDLVFMLEISLE